MLKKESYRSEGAAGERLMSCSAEISPVICFNANKTRGEALKPGFKRDPCELAAAGTSLLSTAA